ncbi:BgTH12-07656 [Blumeria graminis f. sp. triticale]|uniref:BgTH12-07656 n=1 Tax=Blumeria graminis f. sp. triticale TaxID=1689686 RepID=A0A9W4GE40_BLUGR|nr:BgTH12-07656 [Blumeria graminis f. sp. triticale]
MISCAYALLFSGYRASNGLSSSYHSSYNRAKEPTRVDVPKSLVFLADGFGYSFYGAYEFPSNGQFPRPDAQFDIAMTIDTRIDPRTNVVAYCSPTLSSMKIIETFKYDLTPMGKTYYADSIPPTTSERNCQELIQEEWYQLLENSSRWPKELAQNRACSSRDIISLAHRGLLLVTGVYSEMAPMNEAEVPKVNVRSSVDLHLMVSPEQILGTWKYRATQMALVWYFGHLHLFERESGSTTWWPKTKIEVEQGNGSILIHFMRYYMNLFNNLDDRIAQYGFLYRAVDLIPCSSCIPLDTENKSDHIMVEIRKLRIERQRTPYHKFLIEKF